MSIASTSGPSSNATSNGTNAPTWASLTPAAAACKSQSPPKPSVSSSLTVSIRGILGYGAIGRHCAHLAKGLGMEVYAYTRSERTTPESRKDDTYCVPGTGDPDGELPAKWFSGSSEEAVNDFLGQDLDILVISVPLNDSARGLIGPAQLQILAKKKTFVSNVARGPVVDTDALVDALQKGLIRGAALDVTDPEPLPKGHPLWKAPNVFITPHVAWQSTKYPGVLADLLMENLTRLANKKPLLNLDKKA